VSRAHNLVSDHAVLRYLERVYGVDITRLRSRILKDTELAREHAAEAITCDGTRYVLSKSGKVVTATGVDGDMMTKRGRRWRKRRT